MGGLAERRGWKGEEGRLEGGGGLLKGVGGELGGSDPKILCQKSSMDGSGQQVGLALL